MKKTLTTAALSSVLVLGMASAAMAIHTEAPAETAVNSAGAAKVTIDGAVRMRGMINKNSSAANSTAGTGYDGRVRLGVKAVVAPGAIGYMQLESGLGTSDNYPWGGNTLTGTTGATGSYTGTLFNGGTKSPMSLDLIQAWVVYQPSNWGVKVGHMPLALGNKVFFDHTGSGDDAVVAFMNPNDSTHMAGLLIKFAENAAADNSDDLDGYVALITHKFSDSLSVGANWTYLRGSDDLATDPGLLVGGIVPGMSMSNIGLTVDGKATGAISYSADVEMQFGTFVSGALETAVGGAGASGVSSGTGNDIDASGYAVRLAGNMDLGGGTVGLLYGYGSGDDAALDDDVNTFVNFLTDTNWDVIIGNYRATIPGTFTMYSGLSNLSLYQINASTSFSCPISGKDVDMNGSISYMKLNEGIMVGTAMQDEVGTEIDLVTTWHLTPGLDYKIEAAYQAVGDVYGANTDDLYFLRHRLELSF